jgi:two-component system, response regulator PdtaR
MNGASQPRRYPTTTPPRRVVIADTEPATQRQIQMALQNTRYFVVGTAYTAAEAANLVQRQRADVVIADIELVSVKTGGRQWGVWPATEGPLLIVTAYSDREIAAHGALPGVAAYIIKPANARMLPPALDIAIAREVEVRAARCAVAAARARLRGFDSVTRAKRILMRTRDISEREAYRRLQKQSMDTRMSLLDVAATMLPTAARRDESVRWIRNDEISA